MFVIALFALLLLSWFGQSSRTVAGAESSGETPIPSAEKPDAPATSDFPYQIKFEQGATHFLEGDKITIQEVRGTAETFAPGNFYWIKGTYTLASRDRAMLAAYITASNAKDGTGPTRNIQKAVINQGNGTFTLLLPMSCRGLPHVSFYPADGGEGFGGNYFGTGDSVLKRWWGSQEKDPQAPGEQTSKPTIPGTSEFPYKLKMEQGATQFQDGDKITIEEVRGTADTFASGNIYCIKGTYTLASCDTAILLASITVTDSAVILRSRDLAVRADHVIHGNPTGAIPGQATGIELKVQRVAVQRGTGNFTLFLPMSHKGLPHVSFYSSKNGEGFGGNYFGTGDSVLKRWWNTKESD